MTMLYFEMQMSANESATEIQSLYYEHKAGFDRRNQYANRQL